MALATFRVRQTLAELRPDLLPLLDEPRETKLNLGSGGDVHGTDSLWLNVDRSYPEGVEPPKFRGDIRNRERLAEICKPGTASLIYTAHVLEHIPYKDVTATLKLWADMLRPGGVLYVNVPDPVWAIAHHSGQLGLVHESRRWRGSIEWDRVQGLIYMGGDHQTTWWEEGLVEKLEESGLNVSVSRAPKSPDANWLAFCEITAIGVKP